MGENTLTLLHHNRAHIASLLNGRRVLVRSSGFQEVDRALALLGSELCNEKTSGDIHDGKQSREEIGKAEYSVRDYLTNQLASENRAGPSTSWQEAESTLRAFLKSCSLLVV